MSLASGKRPFREYIDELRAKRDKQRARVQRAFAQSPAVIIQEGDRRELVIIGKDPSSPDEWRATTFMPDGPWGHSTYKTRDEAVEAVSDRTTGSIHAATDDDVQEWTTTPEFIHGSKVVAFIQAANALRYWASQRRDKALDDRIWKLVHSAEAMEDIDAATAILERELREVAPKENRGGHPAWVTTALADAYETMTQRVTPAWLPKISHVQPGRGGAGKVKGRLEEYGCGKYGCVFPTYDPGIVLKITTDDTEAQFAAELSHDLVAPITVEYHTVMRLPAKRAGRGVYLLWRESAEFVGQVASEIGGPAQEIVDYQHAAAQDVLHLILDRAPMSAISEALSIWLYACEVHMGEADSVPELQPLGLGLARVFHEQRIFFGDVHTGNLGRVKRNGEERWVITDPGNVIVFGG